MSKLKEYEVNLDVNASVTIQAENEEEANDKLSELTDGDLTYGDWHNVRFEEIGDVKDEKV